jgi:hypothetical protein
MWVGDQRHAPADSSPGKNRYPLYRRLGGPLGRSGQVRKFSLPPGFDPWTVQPVARHAPASFHHRERPGTCCTGGWLEPKAGLDRCGKSHPHRDSIPGPSSPVPVAVPTELPGPQVLLYPYKFMNNTPSYRSSRNC